MAEIYNFVEVSPVLSTSGIIPAERFQHLADESFDVVINLLPDPSEYAVPGEAEIIGKFGIDYVYIPVDFANPTPEDFAQFARAMHAARGRKVWAHCAANYRVSAFVSIYGQLYLGWSAEEGQALVDQLWQPNDVWDAFIQSQLSRR
jgi:protein tyrosine phosphatase (PTP) superfamily phosphohydrolase (DUF442 family)